MSNDDILQVQDLRDGKLDVATVAEVAMVGTTADTTTNREGVAIDTLEGRLKKVGFEPPLPYAAGITFTDAQDAVKSFDRDGIVYGCLASSRPFTTTGNFQNDSANFFVIQDTSEIGDVRTNQDNTYDAGTTQSFDDAEANSLRVNGVDLTTKNNSQDLAISIASSTATTANNTANTANSTANTANSTANTANNTANANTAAIDALAAPSIYITSNGKTNGVSYRVWSDGTVEQWASSVLRTGGDSANQPISFAVNMPNSNYEIQTSYDSGVGDRSPIIAGNRSASQFSILIANNNTTFSWSVRSS